MCVLVRKENGNTEEAPGMPPQGEGPCVDREKAATCNPWRGLSGHQSSGPLDFELVASSFERTHFCHAAPSVAYCMAAQTNSSVAEPGIQGSSQTPPSNELYFLSAILLFLK